MHRAHWPGKQPEINTTADKFSRELDRVFDFNAMLLPHHLAPPVLQESRLSLHLADADSIRLSDRIIEIVRPARFVTTTPRWQDYIQMHYSKPERPNKVMLPETRLERGYWDQYVVVGWHQGIEQANTIFRESLGKLVRDMQGMGLYRSLLAQNMVSPPYVASAKLGITGDADKMRLNDQIMRITARSNLLPGEASKWQPALVDSPEPGEMNAPQAHAKRAKDETLMDDKLQVRDDKLKARQHS